MPRVTRQSCEQYNTDNRQEMLQTPDEVDECGRIGSLGVMKDKMRDEEGTEEAHELRMRRGHTVSLAEFRVWPGLTDEPLEAPIDTLTSKLANEGIDESELPTVDDNGDVRAEQEDRGEGHEGHELCPAIS